MANINRITGVQQVLANLRRHNAQLERRIETGLKLAGLRLQRESQSLVPVDTGNLKNSAFTRMTGRGYNAQVNVGYTAAYALFVHENVEMKLQGQPRSNGKGEYWDPQGRAQAKFLEEPARRLRGELRETIRQYSRII